MNIVFTLQEMKDALLAAGYQLKEMEVEIESPFKGTPSKFINTTNVFKDGKEICSWGYQRVEYVFNELLKEKLLGLVSSRETAMTSYWEHKCADCNYQGDNFTQECLPDGNSGEFSNYWLCPNCHSHAGKLVEVTK